MTTLIDMADLDHYASLSPPTCGLPILFGLMHQAASQLVET